MTVKFKHQSKDQCCLFQSTLLQLSNFNRKISFSFVSQKPIQFTVDLLQCSWARSTSIITPLEKNLLYLERCSQPCLYLYMSKLETNCECSRRSNKYLTADNQLKLYKRTGERGVAVLNHTAFLWLSWRENVPYIRLLMHLSWRSKVVFTDKKRVDQD